MLFVGALAWGIACANGSAEREDASNSGGMLGCEQGTDGCPCYGNATCNAGLLCEADIDRCVAETCMPGAEGCPCVDGECLGELACIDDVLCGAPEAGTTAAPTTTESSDATLGDGGGSSSEGPATESSGGGSDAPQCVDPAAGCDACVCESCGAEVDACMADVGCVAITDCAQAMMCTGVDCLGPCGDVIEMHGGPLGPSATLASALSDCRTTLCADLC